MFFKLVLGSAKPVALLTNICERLGFFPPRSPDMHSILLFLLVAVIFVTILILLTACMRTRLNVHPLFMVPNQSGVQGDYKEMGTSYFKKNPAGFSFAETGACYVCCIVQSDFLLLCHYLLRRCSVGQT